MINTPANTALDEVPFNAKTRRRSGNDMASQPAPRSGIALQYHAILRHRLFILTLIAAVIVVSLVTDFTLGPSGLTLSELWQTLIAPESVSLGIQTIVWDIRLPYALTAIVVGLSLGLAGAEMQTVLNNPLASPFTLGVSSAAAFGAALAIILGIAIPGVPSQWVISANAFIFALLASMTLDVVARWTRIASSGVVLFGIALVFTFNALVAMLQFIATEDALQGLVLWTMGNLGNTNWIKLTVLTIGFILMLPWSMSQAWKMTALRLGEDRASSFGIDVKRLRLSALLRISVLSALSVAFVGPIGFIGLVAPHIARLIFGEDHRFYLPGSALIGALVLSMASIASKNLLHGVVIPVGIVTSLVGVPFFLYIVLRYRGRV